MTLAEYIAQLKAKRDAITTLNKPLAIAVADTHAKMIARIFDEGLDSQGFRKSYNSTHELYINPNHSPIKFTPQGKNKAVKSTKVFDINTKKAKKVSIKGNFTERVTKYFESYKDFRASIGREVQYWNLQLFGILRNDFTNGLQQNDINEWTANIKNPQNKGKLLKFSSYFKLNDAERQNFKEVLLLELTRAIK